MNYSKKLLPQALLLCTTLFNQPASAQMAVIDVANLAENTAIFLKNAAMLKIMIDNIQKGKGEWETALPLLTELEQLIEQGEAIAYSTENLAAEFTERFPGYESKTELWQERSKLLTDTQLDTLKNVLLASAKQNENFYIEQPLIEAMLSSSNSAVGHMQVMQHGNALVGANIKQLVKLRQLVIAQTNAETVYRAAETARRAETEAKGVLWTTAAPLTLSPMSASDPRGIGDLNIIKPK